MDGRDRSCGAVAGVSRSKSPVRLARAIMERPPHVMFMGNGTDELNAELGLDVVEPAYFITDLLRRHLRQAQQPAVIALYHDSTLRTFGSVSSDPPGHLATPTHHAGMTTN